jgi:hypothetical protein
MKPAAVVLALALVPSLAAADVAGPIRVSPNGRHFVDRAGKPFFWLGDTAWPLFNEYPVEAAETYLRNRSEKGFTVVQAVLAWTHGGTGFEKTRTPMANVEGEKPWLNDDPATPNDRYFRHVDRLVRLADQLDLVLAILPTWGHYVNGARVVTTANARAYGRWLGTRYRPARNVIWVLGGDREATGFEGVWREMAAGLRAGDGGAHLIGYHPAGWRTSAQYFHREPWLAFNMIQTWTEWAKIHPAVVSDVLRTPNKPVVLAEGAYEDGPEYPLGPITPLLVRRQAWWTVMAGGFHTYGQNQMWRLEPGWEKTFDTPGAAHVAVMKRVLGAQRWWDAVPDQTLFATGVSSEQTLNTALRSASEDWALVYLASQCTVVLHTDRVAGPRVKATWIDPRTGERKDAGLLENSKRQKQSFTTPGHWEDAVLLLESVRDPR